MQPFLVIYRFCIRLPRFGGFNRFSKINKMSQNHQWWWSTSAYNDRGNINKPRNKTKYFFPNLYLLNHKNQIVFLIFFLSPLFNYRGWCRKKMGLKWKWFDSCENQNVFIILFLQDNYFVREKKETTKSRAYWFQWSITLWLKSIAPAVNFLSLFI